MTDAQKLAEVAFTAYAQDAGGVAVNGQLIPDWNRVGADVQAHWRAAVRAVFNRLGLSLADDDEGGPDGS